MERVLKKKKKQLSLLQKVIGRQLCGKQRSTLFYFDKCADEFQIPLKKILDENFSKKGVVCIGFTPDGKYLLSYHCQLIFQLDSEPVQFKYTLQWWLFDLWNPLRKVHESALFCEETISNELVLVVCQPPQSDYIVIHGATFSVDALSSGKMSYVSIVPTAEATVMNYCLHLRYELLPPHPPFITSLCLKLPNVVLLNSGDMLFAILLNDERFWDSNEKKEMEKSDESSKPSCCCVRNIKDTFDRKTSSGSVADASSLNIENTRLSSDITDSTSISVIRSFDKRLHVSSNSLTTSNNSCTTEIRVDQDSIKPVYMEPCHYNNDRQKLPTDFSCEYSNDLGKKKTHCEAEASQGVVKDYVSFVTQGYCMPISEESQDSLPESPFDCTATVMPCVLSTTDSSTILKLGYEHRCFKNRNKGCKADCNIFICQAQFDVENFVNEEIQNLQEIKKRLVSLRDYDMQLVEVCQETNEVIVLINALIVLRDKACDSGKEFFISSSHRQEKLSNYNLYIVGFLISWNVYTGHVTILKTYPLVESHSTLCKTRQFNPSLKQAVAIRKTRFTPLAMNASVISLSNHTVFSGRSLQYLVHPHFPVAVVR